MDDVALMELRNKRKDLCASMRSERINKEKRDKE